MLVKRFFGFMRPGKHAAQRDRDVFTKNASQLAYMVRVASQKGVVDPLFWNQVTRHLPYVSDGLNGRSLAHIASGLSRVRMYNKDTWDVILGRFHQISNEMKYNDMILFGNVVSKVKHDYQNVLVEIANRIQLNVKEVHPRYIALLVKSLAKFVLRFVSTVVYSGGHRDPQLLGSLVQQAVERASDMSITSIAIMLDGLYNLGYLDRNILKFFAKQVIYLLEQQEILRKLKILKVSEKDASSYNKDTSCTDGSHQDPSIGNIVTSQNNGLDYSECDPSPDGLSCILPSPTLGIEFNDADKAVWCEVKTGHLALIHRAYSNSSVYYNRQLMDAIFKQMIRLCHHFKPIEIMMVANSMSKSRTHNRQLINEFTKLVLKFKGKYSLDMIVVFLHGIIMPSNNDKEFLQTMLQWIVKEYRGKIEAKHALTLMQIMTKAELPLGKYSSVICNCMLESYMDLGPLELVNAVAYLTKLFPEVDEVKNLVERYMELYNGHDVIRNAQQLAILYYALSRMDDPSYDDYRQKLLTLMESIPTEHYEPIHVANTLRAMSICQHARSGKLIEVFAGYLSNNMNKFTPQLLSSSLYSLRELQYTCNELLQELCRYVPTIKKHAVLRDHLSYMRFLTWSTISTKMENCIAIHDTVNAFVCMSDRISAAVEQEESCDNLQVILEDCIQRIVEFQELLDETDVESREILIAAAQKLRRLVDNQC